MSIHKLSIKSFSPMEGTSPQKYKGVISHDGTDYAVSFSPRVKGDVAGLHIATMPSALVKACACATNKSLSVKALEDALAHGNPIDVDLTAKPSTGPRASTSPRAKKSDPTFIRSALYAGTTLTLSGVDFKDFPTTFDLTPDEIDLVKVAQLVRDATSYYAHLYKPDPHASARLEASIEAYNLMVEDGDITREKADQKIAALRACGTRPSIYGAAKLWNEHLAANKAQ